MVPQFLEGGQATTAFDAEASEGCGFAATAARRFVRASGELESPETGALLQKSEVLSEAGEDDLAGRH